MHTNWQRVEGHVQIIAQMTHMLPNEKGAYIAVRPGDNGAGCRFRTGHLMITNQLLYQMS
jgi:hypothetical protein